MTPRLDGLPWNGQRVALEAAGDPGRLAISRLADGLVVGHASLAVEGDTLHVAELVIEPAHRGFGAGTEAARLLIDAASSSGFRRITAWAPPGLGLATYFWFRMGLRAVHGSGPGGGLLYERELRAA